MKILIMGATGFLGYNLMNRLYPKLKENITCFSRNTSTLKNVFTMANCIDGDYTYEYDFDALLKNQEVVYHLISTTYPATSNRDIAAELSDNVLVTIKFLNACHRQNVKKIVFVSSGGTVYGNDVSCPIKESDVTNPINSYGIQKLTIEKLLYLYRHVYGLDYRIIRLSNPYGPHQRISNGLGVITNFVNKAICGQPITVYGDGSVVRDFIYVDDAITGIMKITEYDGRMKLFNLGSGEGKSIKQIIDEIELCFGHKLKVNYVASRDVDVPINILDMQLYNDEIGSLQYTTLPEGIKKTLNFQLSQRGLINA